MTTSEIIESIKQIDGNSIVSKNKVLQLDELFKQTRPIELIKILDEAFQEILTANEFLDRNNLETCITPRQLCNIFYNLGLIKEAFLAIQKLEEEINKKNPYFIMELEKNGVKL